LRSEWNFATALQGAHTEPMVVWLAHFGQEKEYGGRGVSWRVSWRQSTHCGGAKWVAGLAAGVSWHDWQSGGHGAVRNNWRKKVRFSQALVVFVLSGFRLTRVER